MRSTNIHPARTTGGIGAIVLILAAVLLAGGTGPAEAGFSVGISIGTGGFSFGLGYSDYPVYSPAWSQPGFSFSFQTTLAGYGEWITVPGMGSVWRPWVAPGWRPYTWGRWVYTAYGWTWVAYEPWGYVPHHYGAWAMTSFGWVWSPGYAYHPANVTWVGCGSWVGWYPAPPPGWSQARHAWWNGYGAGHYDGYRTGYGHGYADGWQDARYANFVPWNQMTADNIASVATPGSRLRQLGPTSVRVLPAAPGRTVVQRAVGRPIPTVRVSERTLSMGDRRVRAVRPVGVESSIAAHSRQTVRRSLAPGIARAMDRGVRVTERPSLGSSTIASSPALRRSGAGRASPFRGSQRSTAVAPTGSRTSRTAPMSSPTGNRRNVRSPERRGATSAFQAGRTRPSTRVQSRSVSRSPRSTHGEARFTRPRVATRAPASTRSPSFRRPAGHTAPRTARIATSRAPRSFRAPASPGSPRRTVARAHRVATTTSSPRTGRKVPARSAEPFRRPARDSSR